MTAMESEKRAYPCKNVFIHPENELTEIFTDLWTQLINERESSNTVTTQNVVLQTNTLGL